MLFWSVAAVLSVLAVGAIVLPMLRRAPDAGGRHDVEVYRDQLAEIARDRDAGLVAGPEAEAARAEVARRLIAAAGEPERRLAPASSLRAIAAVAVAVFVPVFSLAVYVRLGAPGATDQPLVARLDARPSADDVPALVARVEKNLELHPDDLSGWRVLAPVYMRMGRFDDAVAAWRRVAGAPGADVDAREQWAEAMVAANDGIVSAEAQSLFAGVLAADPDRPKSRFYHAEGLRQSGDLAGALAEIDRLIGQSPADAPWLAATREKRSAVLAAMKRPDAPPEPATMAARSPDVAPGPSAADVATAATMSADDRAAMVAGMVDGLAARLAAAPGDAGGWARLIRAYMVLGREGEARAAVGRARAVFKDDAARLRLVDEAAAAAGLGS